VGGSASRSTHDGHAGREDEVSVEDAVAIGPRPATRTPQRAILATMTVGLMAGVFAAYANAIMPGLRRTDDRTFVGVFPSIDTAIISPLFLAAFLGALVFTGLVAALHLGEDVRSVRPWSVAALVLYLASLVVTARANVPLNDGIKVAGAPDRIADVTSVREQFNEATWVRWNLVRALLTAAALGCLAWSLVLLGRAAETGGP
jgi:uncharacterized membrane protein